MTEPACAHRAALRTRDGATLATNLLLDARPEPGQHLIWDGQEYHVVAIAGWEYLGGEPSSSTFHVVLLVEECKP